MYFCGHCSPAGDLKGCAKDLGTYELRHLEGLGCEYRPPVLLGYP